MKKLRRMWAFGTSTAVIGFAVMGGCTAPEEIYRSYCDPDAPFLDKPCRNDGAGTDSTPDTDAGTDADTDASSAINDIPGFTPWEWSVCPGACVPEPSDTSAGAWPNEPLLVWMGPLADMPTECPKEAPFMKWKRYDKLVAPPAQCEVCSCESAGTCSGLPASIEIHSGACNASNVEVRPFDGPANWNGSCTSNNSMPAGTLCNGAPCAQSVHASALPGPTMESCTPTNEQSTATTEYHWEDGVLACGATELQGACASSPNLCVQTKSEPWLHCVAAMGIRDVCPGNYEVGPFVYYAEQPIDDRGCSDCSCGAPSGICVGSLRVYSDAICGNQFLQIPLASIDASCGSVLPPGRAVGSKTITDLAYIPGICAVSGGEPIGAAIPNATGTMEATTPVTFCCRKREEPAPIEVPS